MIFPNNTVLGVIYWIAKRLGFDLDLRKEGIVDSLEEQEIADQLQYGRD